MPWIAATSVGMGLLGMSEQRKANSQASDAAAQANQANNALRDQAMPYALQNLQTNAALQKFYQKNPFNPMQKAGYQNQANQIDSFNGQVAPGLLSFANGMMGQSYSRQGGNKQSAPTMEGGLLGGMFKAPQYQNIGQIDWEGINPYNNKSVEALQNLPTTTAVGQSDNPIWEQILADFDKEHTAKYGTTYNWGGNGGADEAKTLKELQKRYSQKV